MRYMCGEHYPLRTLALFSTKMGIISSRVINIDQIMKGLGPWLILKAKQLLGLSRLDESPS
jgi:hypothetical protein